MRELIPLINLSIGVAITAVVFIIFCVALHQRAVKMTEKRIRANLPVSESDINASISLIKAEYAVKVCQLENRIKELESKVAHQQIEVNRKEIELVKMRNL